MRFSKRNSKIEKGRSLPHLAGHSEGKSKQALSYSKSSEYNIIEQKSPYVPKSDHLCALQIFVPLLK